MFTGATDKDREHLSNPSTRAVQLIGVPDGNMPPVQAEIGVVALKSRTVPAAEAVAQSIAALDWLRDQAVRSFSSNIARLSLNR